MLQNPPLILIVDDEPLSRDALSGRLARRNFAIESLASGQAALEAIQLRLPDLILMDVSMPGMSGIETLQKIRETWAQDYLPVILVSALTDSEDVIAGLEAGANDFVVKPVNLPVLVARIKVCLQARTAVLAREQAEQMLRFSEERLRRANDELDQRVRERTAELDRTNQSLTAEIVERKKATELLIAYQEKLRALAAQISLAEEQERRRIARGLHDHIGQNLVLTKMKLGALHELNNQAARTQVLDEVHPLLEQAIKQIRTLTFELGSRVLYDFGLSAALENLTEQMRDQHGIPASFKEDDLPKPIAEDIQVALFQAARELLHNVVKHAHPKSVKVSLVRVGDSIRLTVQDDGIGCRVDDPGSAISTTDGFGLFSIRERLEYLGANMEFKSELGAGTSIFLTAPLQR